MNHHVLLKHIEHLEVSLKVLKELKSRETISPPAVKTKKIACIADNCTAFFQTKSEVRIHFENKHRVAEHVDPKNKTSRRRGSNVSMSDHPEKKIKENFLSPVIAKTVIECQSQTTSQSEFSLENNVCGELEEIKFYENCKMSDASSIVMEVIQKMSSSRFPPNIDPSQFCVICRTFEKCKTQHCKISKQIISTWRHHNDGAEITKNNIILTLKKMIVGYTKKEEKADV